MAQQQPINPGDITIDKSKVAAFAPAREVHLPEGPLPGGLSVPRGALQAFIPPPPTERGEPPAAEDRIQARLLPIGGCVHPVGARWADDGLDMEGCVACGLAQVFRPGQGVSWEQNDGWTRAARKAGVIGAS